MSNKEHPYFYQKVKAIVETNIDNPNFDIAILTNTLGISRSQIYRKIKQSTGLSITSYIRNIRLEHSKKLLESTDWPVSTISREVGFKSISYFSYAFTKQFGHSPNKNRK